MDKTQVQTILNRSFDALNTKQFQVLKYNNRFQKQNSRPMPLIRSLSLVIEKNMRIFDVSHLFNSGATIQFMKMGFFFIIKKQLLKTAISLNGLNT